MTVKLKIKDKLENDTLDLSFCELQDVPIREIMTIKKASHLDLSNNQLVSLPKTIVNLNHIVKLDLSKNMLTEIPENIGEMRQLRHLDLYSNQITRLPLSIGDLKNLKWLDLKDNPLTPAIVDVAGTCSNSSECQTCARKIVAFFTNLKQNIEEEKKRRKIAVTTTTVDESTKKESKKKKKKAAEKDKQSTETSNYSSITQQSKLKGTSELHEKQEITMNKPKSSTNGFCNILGTIIYATTLSLLIIGFFMILIIILLPKYDKTLFNNVIDHLQEQTNLPVKNYQQLVIDKSDLIIDNVFSALNRTKIIVEENLKKIVNNF